jgi:hypothetical protein
MGASAWNSMEVANLIVASLTPLTVGFVGFLLQKTLAQQDRFWKARQQLAERRLAVYNEVRKEINRVHCFVNDIGGWKRDTPTTVLGYKRQVDETMHSNRALWPPDTFSAYLELMNSAFATYQGIGADARIKTSAQEKRQGMPNWEPNWEERLTGLLDPHEPASLERFMRLVARDLTLDEKEAGDHR